jgi:hypothetical protein
LGWQIGTYRQEKVIYHHGGYPGYNNHFSYLPDKKIAVGIAVNSGGAARTVMQMIAAYAYDWWLGVDNVDADYAKRLDEFIAQFSTRKQQAIAAAAERAKRTWQLSKPFSEYSGRYTNELFGTIEITARENDVAVRWGNMNCIATPFTQPDTIRVELEPGGNGEVMKFNKDAADKVVSITYNGLTFARSS